MDGARVDVTSGWGREEPHPDWVEQSACPLGPLLKGEGMGLTSFLPDGEFSFQSG